MNNTPQERIEQYAKEHAIPPGTLKRLGWCFEQHKDSEGRARPAIKFPTANGPRWRFVDGQKPKYIHEAGYKACWYGLEKSVKNLAKDFVVDCNGAASTISAFFAGIPAYSYQSGESTTPDEQAANDFTAIVPKRMLIMVAFDCDPEGQRGAAKRVNWYRSLGYSAEAINLALEKQGGDLADFVASHPDKTLNALILCDFVYVEDDKPTSPPTPRKVIDFQSDSERDYELAQKALDALSGHRRDDYDLWVEVGMALSDLGDRGLFLWDKWSVGGEGYKPGACQRKWKSFKKSGKTLATLFYLADQDLPTWRPYTAPTDNYPRTVAPSISYEKKEILWTDGVPTALRAGMMQYMHPACAPTLELWFEGIRRGDLDWFTPVTVQYLLCLSQTYDRGVSESVIRRGLKLGADIFLSVSAEESVLDIDSLLVNTKESTLADRNTTGSQIYTPCRKLIGRKSLHYTLLPKSKIHANIAQLAIAPILEKHFPTELGIVPPIRIEFLKQLGCDENEAARLEKELDEKYGDLIASQRGYALILKRAKSEYKRYERSLANPHSAPIPDGLPYGNKSQYLRACARALITQEHGHTQWAQSAWTRLLGCSPRSLDGIFKAADIDIEKNQHCDVPIPSIEALQRIQDAYSTECQGYPSEVISSKQRDAFPFVPGQPLYVWAGAQLESGATVTLRYQQAHKQHLLPVRKPKLLTYWRWLCQRVVIAIMIANPIPFKEQTKKKRKASKPKPTYGEKVINVMVEKFTSLKADETAVIDPITGEYVDPTVDALLKALLATAPDPVASVDAWADDPLVSAMLARGGVVVAVVTTEVERVAA